MPEEVPAPEDEPGQPAKRGSGSPISDLCRLMWDAVNGGWGTTLRLFVIMIPLVVLLAVLILVFLVQIGWISFGRDGDRP